MRYFEMIENPRTLQVGDEVWFMHVRLTKDLELFKGKVQEEPSRPIFIKLGVLWVNTKPFWTSKYVEPHAFPIHLDKTPLYKAKERNVKKRKKRRQV